MEEEDIDPLLATMAIEMAAAAAAETSLPSAPRLVFAMLSREVNAPEVKVADIAMPLKELAEVADLVVHQVADLVVHQVDTTAVLAQLVCAMLSKEVNANVATLADMPTTTLPALLELLLVCAMLSNVVNAPEASLADMPTKNRSLLQLKTKLPIDNLRFLFSKKSQFCL